MTIIAPAENAALDTAAAAITHALAGLASHAEHARGAFAPNTERALRADAAAFDAWCAAAGHTAAPAAPETVAAFVAAMAASRSPATIRRYLSSLATLHRLAGLPNPTAAVPVTLALKRLHRERGRAQAQAAPLNRGLVDRMLALPGDRPADRRDRALLAVAYDTLCRRAEMVGLQIEDVQPAADGSGTVLVRRSKTDQEGAGAVRYLAPDTMHHLRAWLDAAAIEAGPIFRAVGKAGRIGEALSAAAVAGIFKARAAAAGVALADVARISGHSSRVGAAQDMVQWGVELPAVMQAGGWKSPEMVSRYSARLAAKRGGAAKLAVLQNRA